MPPMDEAVDDVLQEIATTAEQVVEEQREVARQARDLRAEHQEGSALVHAWDRQPPPGVLARLRAGSRRLADATSRLSRSAARGMAEEGESRRAIAKRLGVSHQRVTSLLNRHGAGSGSGN